MSVNDATLEAMAREIAELEELAGPGDLKVSFKLDEYAAALRQANRLLEATNIEARAKAIRRQQYSQEVDLKHGEDAIEEGVAYKPSSKAPAGIIVFVLFLVVGGGLYWAYGNTMKSVGLATSKNEFREKTFSFGSGDDIVVRLQTAEGETIHDYSDSGFATEEVPTRKLSVTITPADKKKFGRTSSEFLEYYTTKEFGVKIGMAVLVENLKLVRTENGYEASETIAATTPDNRPIPQGGLWKVFWAGSPPCKEPALK